VVVRVLVVRRDVERDREPLVRPLGEPELHGMDPARLET
jgi:hypothetical protein